MDIDLPAPLVAPGADLTDFAFTPIFRARLFASRFHARATDAEWRAGVTLWLKSWDQVPAGSLPDDDVDLCRLAELGRDLKTWKKLKAGALHGWRKCADGLLYHETVAEGVMEAWLRKQKQRDRGNKGASARWSKPPEAMLQASQTLAPADASSIACPMAEAMLGDGKGQGQWTVDREPSSLRSEGAPAEPKARRTASKARSQIPPDWRPDASGRTYATDRGIIVDQELPAFINHHQARGNLMASWDAAWRTWCDNQVKFGRAPGKPAGGAALTLIATNAAPTPDPWGIRAWTSRQPGVGSGTDPKTGVKHPAINGFIVEQSAEAVAEAAGLPEHWRGSWDALGAWMRADIDLTPTVLAAITDQARRMRSKGQTIGSIKVFDVAVQAGSERAHA